ncbi:hypothetical protein [Actinomyces sp. oral taxon 448]|uniref:hypothetical protein n=1 Tax=Actinomyces sp. oral taxon 448 TaxID=712124 RepID=UPI0025BF6952|nr:hypothetical protein [Actinomyces sp. oral taxon 448]
MLSIVILHVPRVPLTVASTSANWWAWKPSMIACRSVSELRLSDGMGGGRRWPGGAAAGIHEHNVGVEPGDLALVPSRWSEDGELIHPATGPRMMATAPGR